MQFILPSRFNVVKNSNQCTTGVNILVPENGVTKPFKQFLENAATTASKSRMIIPHIQEMRTCPYSLNNFSPEVSARMPFFVEGLSHCVYSRVTPMTFRSVNLKENMPYSDYVVAVNAIMLAAYSMKNRVDWHKLVEDFYDWSRLRELHIDFRQDLVISRCTTPWKTIRRVDIPFLAQSLIIECSNTNDVQGRLSLLDKSGIQGIMPHTMRRVG